MIYQTWEHVAFLPNSFKRRAYQTSIQMKQYISILIIISCAGIFSCSSIKYKKSIDQYRTTYKQDFQDSPRAPLKGKQLDSMRYFKIDPAYKVLADLEMLQDAKPIYFPTAAGTKSEYIPYANAHFILNGKQQELTIYWSVRLSKMPGYKNYLFLPFTDDTNGTSSYGGGRYLSLDKTDIKNNQLILDFNKAYNPYCHYKSGYQCPIPPRCNDLNVAIKAGEAKYIGQYQGDHE